MAHPSESTALTKSEIENIRSQFPILSSPVRGKPLVYLDNAATTQKPRSVIESELQVYEKENANVHRGVHSLSQIASEKFEQSRERARAFVNAKSTNEIIFTKGCTEAINLVASSWGSQNLKSGDEILLSTLEHHSNIVPWQIIAEKTGASIKVLDILDSGELDYEQLPTLLSEKTKLVAVTQVSNAIGSVPDIIPVVRAAHSVGAKVLVDGAQAVAHFPIDVQEIGADFFVFSGHKMYGPTGVGVLYGKESVLDAMPPYQGGGDMIRTVSFERTTYADLPSKFEAGTPNVAGVIAFAEAVRFVSETITDAVRSHEQHLLKFVVEKLRAQGDVRVIGNPKHRSGVVSFLIECAHPHDVATILDTEGIAIRSGHHCSMPLMKRLGIHGTARISVSAYNTFEEIEFSIEALNKVREIFQ